MQQHHVEITAGTQRTPGVAADRHQRPPAWEHLAERGEPTVGLLGERARQRLAGERRVADQGESGGADRAGVRWPLAGASGHRSERVAQGVDELGGAEAGVELQGTDEPGAALDGVELAGAELPGPELAVAQPEPAVARLGGWSTPSITWMTAPCTSRSGHTTAASPPLIVSVSPDIANVRASPSADVSVPAAARSAELSAWSRIRW